MGKQQKMLHDVTSLAERAVNLLNWTHPRKTGLLAGGMAAGLAALVRVIIYTYVCVRECVCVLGGRRRRNVATTTFNLGVPHLNGQAVNAVLTSVVMRGASAKRKPFFSWFSKQKKTLI